MGTLFKAFPLHFCCNGVYFLCGTNKGVAILIVYCHLITVVWLFDYLTKSREQQVDEEGWRLEASLEGA